MAARAPATAAGVSSAYWMLPHAVASGLRRGPRRGLQKAGPRRLRRRPLQRRRRPRRRRRRPWRRRRPRRWKRRWQRRRQQRPSLRQQQPSLSRASAAARGDQRAQQPPPLPPPRPRKKIRRSRRAPSAGAPHASNLTEAVPAFSTAVFLCLPARRSLAVFFFTTICVTILRAFLCSALVRVASLASFISLTERRLSSSVCSAPRPSEKLSPSPTLCFMPT